MKYQDIILFLVGVLIPGYKVLEFLWNIGGSITRLITKVERQQRTVQIKIKRPLK